MHASVGDRIIVRATYSDRPDRDGEVLEVHGEDGTPPYLVRWADTGHESLVFPGSDAYVQHFSPQRT
jgi:hypothetical protein